MEQKIDDINDDMQRLIDRCANNFNANYWPEGDIGKVVEGNYKRGFKILQRHVDDLNLEDWKTWCNAVYFACGNDPPQEHQNLRDKCKRHLVVYLRKRLIFVDDSEAGLLDAKIKFFNAIFSGEAAKKPTSSIESPYRKERTKWGLFQLCNTYKKDFEEIKDLYKSAQDAMAKKDDLELKVAALEAEKKVFQRLQMKADHFEWLIDDRDSQIAALTAEVDKLRDYRNRQAAAKRKETVESKRLEAQVAELTAEVDKLRDYKNRQAAAKRKETVESKKRIKDLEAQVAALTAEVDKLRDYRNRQAKKEMMEKKKRAAHAADAAAGAAAIASDAAAAALSAQSAADCAADCAVDCAKDAAMARCMAAEEGRRKRKRQPRTYYDGDEVQKKAKKAAEAVGEIASASDAKAPESEESEESDDEAELVRRPPRKKKEKRGPPVPQMPMKDCLADVNKSMGKDELLASIAWNIMYSLPRGFTNKQYLKVVGKERKRLGLGKEKWPRVAAGFLRYTAKVRGYKGNSWKYKYGEDTNLIWSTMCGKYMISDFWWNNFRAVMVKGKRRFVKK